MDRYPTRWGRRLPWMIMFWLPLSISFTLIWIPPRTNELGIFIFLIVILLVFDTAYTIVVLAWAAIFPEIYTTAEDRIQVSALRQVLAMLPFYRTYILREEEIFESMAYRATILVTMLALYFWVKYTNKNSAKSTFLLSADLFLAVAGGKYFLFPGISSILIYSHPGFRL